MQTLTFQVYMCHFFNQLVEFSAWGGGGWGVEGCLPSRVYHMRVCNSHYGVANKAEARPLLLYYL